MAKRGPKGYAAEDTIPLADALERMRAGETAWQAAQAVAPQMVGHGTERSKAMRLRGYLARIEEIQDMAQDQFTPQLFVDVVIDLALAAQVMQRLKKKKRN